MCLSKQRAISFWTSVIDEYFPHQQPEMMPPKQIIGPSLSMPESEKSINFEMAEAIQNHVVTANACVNNAFAVGVCKTIGCFLGPLKLAGRKEGRSAVTLKDAP
ncbi:hypothetical protein N7532_010639 [Penicillium argentinense]|uniref:Uncharacterized protein n=1 Tax=Penicillium argentinense TaxID=1131581 RepID=A0A9W9EPZ1_9EURO|nr:uncharacterized protein N7532_010639 [Penicillium argentinense]KAJ5085868.1 hypothetical protein N7532_010639 [Penicillium argentinense]